MNKEIYIINKKNNNKEKLKLKEIKKENIFEVLDLQDEIISKILNKDLYAITTKEEFEFYFGNEDIVIGYYNEKEKLIAFGVCANYKENEHNYGYYLDIEKKDLKTVSQIDTVAVSPEYRGNKLQEIICNNLEEKCKNQDIKILTATVAPDNIHSLNTFIRLGYEVYKEAKMYGGLDRLILRKNL